MNQIPLPEVDRAEITILVDNYTDVLLADTDTVKRLRVPPPDTPMAEHGLAYLVTVHSGDQKHTVLMDAGISGTCLKHNANMLATSLAVGMGTVTHKVTDVESIILSHGHYDHFYGLPDTLAFLDRQIPLVVHPGAFVERRIKMGAEFYVPMPQLTEAMLTKAGAVLDKRSQPSTVADGHLLVAGTVTRRTEFETGTPNLEAQHAGTWEVDGFADDQALAFRVKGKGLVVLGGCSHSGIINTIKHLREVSGELRVHAVMGGFHLGGPSETLIEPTVRAMQELAPQLIVPMHCTGWKAINAFANAMPEQFVLNAVGSTYLING